MATHTNANSKKARRIVGALSIACALGCTFIMYMELRGAMLALGFGLALLALLGGKYITD